MDAVELEEKDRTSGGRPGLVSFEGEIGVREFLGGNDEHAFGLKSVGVGEEFEDGGSVGLVV